MLYGFIAYRKRAQIFWEVILELIRDFYFLLFSPFLSL